MMIYIASPYTKGDTAINVRNSILAAEKVRELGHLPFLPLMSHFWHFLSPHPYEYWTAMDNEWVFCCGAILRLPGESSGASAEVELAKSHGIPVYYSIDDLPVFGRCVE